MFEKSWRKLISQSSRQYAITKLAFEEANRINLRCALGLLLLFIFSLPASAARSYDKIIFDIPQQRADAALIMFAEQADLTLIFPFDEVKEKNTNRVIGTYSLERAIRLLLRNTGLTAHVSDDNQLTIVSKPSFGGLNRMLKKNKISTATIAAMASMMSVNVSAQNLGSSTNVEEIVVTGFRGSLNQALQAKRDSSASIDSIVEVNTLLPDETLTTSVIFSFVSFGRMVKVE